MLADFEPIFCDRIKKVTSLEFSPIGDPNRPERGISLLMVRYDVSMVIYILLTSMSYTDSKVPI